MSIHLVLYSNNEPFGMTKRLTIKSIRNFTQKQIIIHDYNLEKIKQCDWFHRIQNLPQTYNQGRRDGYYNSWKPFITKEVYDIIPDGDILYYVDCSQYFRYGFTENVDKLCDIASELTAVAGSVGDDVRNNSFGCCDNIMVWDKIIPNNNNNVYINERHVLNSWFLFKKCDSNRQFINDWVYYSCYVDNDFNHPLVTYHHTADQSIFNILVIKHKMTVFYSKNVGHNLNKNKNIVLNMVNNSTNLTDLFIKI